MIQQFLRSRREHDLDVGSALLSDAVVRRPDALCRRDDPACHELAIDGLQSRCLWAHGRAPAGDLVDVATGCAVRFDEVGDDVVNERVTIVGVRADDDFIELLELGFDALSADQAAPQNVSAMTTAKSARCVALAIPDAESPIVGSAWKRATDGFPKR
jgi:hypothetical protein